jgi:RHS repeat-associated protein
MLKNTRHIIFTFFTLWLCCSSMSTPLHAQAIELDTFYTDSFCVAAPKPLPSDTISWDDERAACIEELRALAIENAIQAWRDSIATLIEIQINKQKCFATAFNETFTVEHQTTEHHYTLYYYDQAGNLVQTISPEGVEALGTGAFPNGVWDGTPPPHDTKHITRYQYNTVGQVVTQFTPDAGKTDFLYDRAQRLRFSQNAEQQPTNDFAYTKYDGQGRVIEVGELINQTPTEDDIRDQSFPGYTESRQDTIITLYDDVNVPPTLPSAHTRGRVAKVDNGHMSSYYDYDAHGNVRELTQIVPLLDDDTISMEYDYDLISGNVKEFRYEPDQELDQLTQRFLYDADNRIQSAYSSDDGYVFEEDARYFYYLHGPLARVELGEDKVQGMDYFYTLQGWIKGMNMPGADPGTEPGFDGFVTGHSNMNRYFGVDRTTYSLGYNNLDYSPILGSGVLSSAMNEIWPDIESEILSSGGVHGLFNGNIALMLTDNSLGLQGMGYQYDALHRIKYANSIKWTTKWGSPGEYTEPLIAYDANGNIDTLERSDASSSDALVYHYYNDHPNRLSHITGTSDLAEIMLPQTMGTYRYDPIGNLIADNSEGTTMTWDVYGKLRSVTGTLEGTLQYTYDTQGNRLKKGRSGAEFPTDIYVRDAGGNIIAVYAKEVQFMDGTVLNRINEFHLYGSSRLGVLKPERVIYTSNSMNEPDPLYTNSHRNLKSYESSNHLGNVLTTISDQKIGQDDIPDGIAEYYMPSILTTSDNYAFGLEMPDRTTSSLSENHRFGFNGKEKDPSMGSLTHYDYGFRIYNPAIGRFLSVDPLTKGFPWYTPYQFAGNTPIQAIDLEGLEIFTAYKMWQNYTKPALKNSNDRGRWYGWLRSTTIDGIADKFITSISNEIKNPSPKPTLKESIPGLIGGPLYNIGRGIYLQTKSAIEGNEQAQGELLGDIALFVIGGVATRAAASADVVAMQGINGISPVKNLTGSNFAQIGRSEVFSDAGILKYSEIAGIPIKTVDDLTNALNQHIVTASDFPLHYVTVNGQKVILNTRTSAALNNAKIPMSEWYGIDVTGQSVPLMPGTIFDDLLNAQLKKSNLPSTGTPQIPK